MIKISKPNQTDGKASSSPKLMNAPFKIAIKDGFIENIIDNMEGLWTVFLFILPKLFGFFV